MLELDFVRLRAIINLPTPSRGGIQKRYPLNTNGERPPGSTLVTGKELLSNTIYWTAYEVLSTRLSHNLLINRNTVGLHILGRNAGLNCWADALDIAGSVSVVGGVPRCAARPPTPYSPLRTTTGH